MLAGDWAHKHRVQQCNKTDYLSTVAHGWPQLYRKDLLLLISSSYSLTFKTTQVFINTHDETLSRYAAHAYCTMYPYTHKSMHASTHTNMNTHVRIPCTHQYPSTWAWSPGIDLFCLYRGHITFLTIHCIIYKNNYMSVHMRLTRLVFTDIICSGWLVFYCAFNKFIFVYPFFGNLLHWLLCLFAISYISQNACKQPSEYLFHSAVGYILYVESR